MIGGVVANVLRTSPRLILSDGGVDVLFPDVIRESAFDGMPF